LRLLKRLRTDPGYETVVTFNDSIGPVKPVSGVWQNEHASF